MNALDTFEELQETAKELKSKDPGYFAKLTSKVINNIQINVENIYIRIEDDLSYPNHFVASGLSIKKLAVETTDKNWETKYVAEDEQLYKKISLIGLAQFFNYSQNKKEVFMKEQIGKDDLQSFIVFCQRQFEVKNDENKYILPPFNTELRVILNKDPKANKKPQIWASLKFGGLFDSPATNSQNHFGLNVELEQIFISMKVFEYIGMYSKFQTGVLLEYQKASFTKEEREVYAPVYQAYINCMRIGDKKGQEEKKQELLKLEERFSLGAIKKVRIAGRLEIDFEERKEEAKKLTEKMVKDMEGKNSSTLSSITSFFGSPKTKEEQEKTKKVEEYRKGLVKEQEEKFLEERMGIDRELNELLSTSSEVDTDITASLPPTYERFRFNFEINQLTLAISQNSSVSKSKKLIEISFKGISSTISLSKQVQKFGFIIESMDVIDYISRNRAFSNLLESRCVEKSSKKDCLNAQLMIDTGNPQSDFNLILRNNCNMVVCFNYDTIFILATQVNAILFKENINTSYYKDFGNAAKKKIDEYIQLGVTFAKDAYNNVKTKHFNIALNIALVAPLLMIPRNPTSSEDSSAFICDLGMIRIKSIVHRKDTEMNYKDIMEIVKLYDYYECKLEKIQIYIKNNSNELVHKYVRNLNLHLRFYNCLEPLHPSMAMFKIGGILNRVDIILTDYNLSYAMEIMSRFQETKERYQTEVNKLRKEVEKQKLAKTINIVKATITKHALGSQKMEQTQEAEIEMAVVEKVALVDMNSGKCAQEIMFHCDDISLIIGKAFDQSIESLSDYESYLKEWQISQPDEVPFLPLLRSGINGVSVYLCTALNGSTEVKAHVFRLYVRDLQLKLERKKTVKVVSEKFEYILSNPSVELITERRTGDNYSCFNNNIDFFRSLENSKFFREKENQLVVNFSSSSNLQQIKLNIILNELAFTLPHQSLVTPLHLMQTINKSFFSKQSKAPVEPIIVQKVVEEKVSKEPYSFDLKMKIQGISFTLPVNVLFFMNH